MAIKANYIILLRQLMFYTLAKINKSILNILPIEIDSAEIRLTDNCNLKCMSCACWRSTKKNELTLEEIDHTLNFLYTYGIRSIVLSGGEALIRRDFKEILELLRKYRFDVILLQTNGLLLSQFTEEIQNSTITHINISIDGDEVTHDRLRGKNGAFKKIIEAIQNYSLKSTKQIIQLVFLLTNENYKELPFTVELCKKLNTKLAIALLSDSLFYFKGIDITTLRGNLQEQTDMIEYIKLQMKTNNTIISMSKSMFWYLSRELKNNRPEIPCTLGYNSVQIGADGSVFSGCKALPSMGNIRETEIGNIINSTQYRKRIIDMFNLNCPKCNCGYQRRLVGHLPSVFRDIFSISSWRFLIKNRSSNKQNKLNI